MRKLFSDLPEACDNTLDIARRCAFMVQEARPDPAQLPDRRRPQRAEELSTRPEEGLKNAPGRPGAGRRGAGLLGSAGVRAGIINKMGFPGYFLIVSDFIKWAKSHGIPVGPGRGSGAGSLVAWVLTITDLDPLRFGLLFERFLNPERVSMPDFDIDFCQERREEVIVYVQEKYGRDRVAQIITFGSLQARAVLRDVGRVMQLPLGLVDRLCKMVPNNPAAPVTLAQAIDLEPRLKQAKKEDGQRLGLSGRRPAAGRPVPQRLDPRRRRGDRRPAADPADAALQGSALGPARHPVQHEVGRERRPGEVRLPGPEDPDGAGPRGEAPEEARRGGRSQPRCRSTTPRPTNFSPRARRSACSSWKARACATRCARCAAARSRRSPR
jgi:hypothetical protein